jgi:hypothetical protein
MAKPINLFQGPAPSAMSQMGAGLVEAGQSIGNAWGNAYSSIGKSIGQGIQTLGAGIGQKMQENKDAESMNKMFDMTLKSPTLSSQLLGIPDDASGREMRDSLMNQKRDIIKEYGLSGAQQFFKGIIQPLGEREMFGREAQLKRDISGIGRKPDYSPIVRDVDKAVQAALNLKAALPSGAQESTAPSPLIEGQSNAPSVNVADMLGQFLTKKYGSPVARPTDQDIIEFDRFLQSGGK